MSLETPIDRAEEDRASQSAARMEEDRALVLAAQSDTAAAGRLFDKYYTEIFRYLCHSTLDHAAAQDQADPGR